MRSEMSFRKNIVALLAISIQLCVAFTPHSIQRFPRQLTIITTHHMSDNEEWSGEVVTNQGGRIKGCTLTKIEGKISEYQIQIDGVEADLGKFSDAIYKKISADAKQQRFQGFRPGTIPPHIVPTYIAFAMDECAREATLEAMQQNNVRPFEDARTELEFTNISIPPQKKRKKKKKGGRKKKSQDATASSTAEGEEEEEETWLTFDNMKDAISAGWKPGQSFSFIANNAKGQQLKDQNLAGAKAIGAGGAAFDLNSIELDKD